MKRLIILFAAVIIFLTACSSNEQIPSVLTDVKTEKQQVEAFGLVKVLEERYISMAFAARINEVYVKEGQKIAKDEPLAMLDMSEAKAQISSKKERLDMLLSKIGQQQLSIENEKTYLKNGNSPEFIALKRKFIYESGLYVELLAEYEGKKELSAEGIMSEAECKSFYKQVEEKEKSVEDARLAMESYKISANDRLMLDESALKLDLLELKSLQMELEQYNKLLSVCADSDGKILSGISDGIIGSVECHSGEIITPGKKIFSVMNLDTLVIEADIDEQFIKDIRLGAKTYIVPEVDRSLEYKGEISFISATAVQKNGETVVPVQIRLEKTDDRLLPNFNVEITIEVE